MDNQVIVAGTYFLILEFLPVPNTRIFTTFVYYLSATLGKSFYLYRVGSATKILKYIDEKHYRKPLMLLYLYHVFHPLAYPIITAKMKDDQMLPIVEF